MLLNRLVGGSGVIHASGNSLVYGRQFFFLNSHAGLSKLDLTDREEYETLWGLITLMITKTTSESMADALMMICDKSTGI